MSAGSKRGGADEASKLRDVILKQRDQTQPLKSVYSNEHESVLTEWFLYVVMLYHIFHHQVGGDG